MIPLPPAIEPQKTTVAVVTGMLPQGTVWKGSDSDGQKIYAWTSGTAGHTTPLIFSTGSALVGFELPVVIAAQNPAPTAQEQVKYIQDLAGYSVTKIARIFKVTRQTVHEWARGGSIGKENAQRLGEFGRALDKIAASQGRIDQAVLERPFFSGVSLLALVTSGGNLVEAAGVVTKVLEQESVQRKALELRFAGRARPADLGSSTGIPHLNENG